MIIVSKIFRQVIFFLLPLIILNEMGYIAVTDKTKKLFNDQLENLKSEIIEKLQSTVDKKGSDAKNLIDKKIDESLKTSQKKIQESSVYLNKSLDEGEKF